jgi:hypothetical protein
LIDRERGACTVLLDLCENLSVVIPESDEHWLAVRSVKDSLGFAPPELEAMWWERLGEALEGLTPETELGRQVIGLYNLARIRRVA